MRRVLLLGLLFVGTAQATDADDLAAALKKARQWTARGQVEVSVFFPPRTTPTRTTNALPAVPFRPALLARNFTVTRGDSEAVAGRPSTRFDLTPKQGAAARWSLWIDREWNVPLAFEERMPDGTLARRAAFLKVNGALARVPVQAVPPVVGLSAVLKAALPGLRLPAGFTPVAAKARAEGQGGTEITLSDGVNVLALIVAPRNVRPAVGVASVRVAGSGGVRFVWLVGNLPDAALKTALANVRQVDEAGLGTFAAPVDAGR
ncbi:transcriptional regulator [Deinococcus sp. Arct2-2]|uniref:transcriptional regulator n=1 Tax=Deinococcus sp. Arct2-2 TaxID=2568653 RepID=UPI001F0E0221|nr:transcriptional regulator [Deinococcus sp. Arct2-2]